MTVSSLESIFIVCQQIVLYFLALDLTLPLLLNCLV